MKKLVLILLILSVVGCAGSPAPSAQSPSETIVETRPETTGSIPIPIETNPTETEFDWGISDDDMDDLLGMNDIIKLNLDSVKSTEISNMLKVIPTYKNLSDTYTTRFYSVEFRDLRREEQGSANEYMVDIMQYKEAQGYAQGTITSYQYFEGDSTNQSIDEFFPKLKTYTDWITHLTPIKLEDLRTGFDKARQEIKEIGKSKTYQYPNDSTPFIGRELPQYFFMSGATGLYSRLNERVYEGERVYTSIKFDPQEDHISRLVKVADLVYDTIEATDPAEYVPVVTLEQKIDHDMVYTVKIMRVNQPTHKYILDVYMAYKPVLQFEFAPAPEALVNNYKDYIQLFYDLLPVDDYSDLLKSNMEKSMQDLLTQDMAVDKFYLSDDEYFNVNVSSKDGNFEYHFEAIADEQGKLIKLPE